MRALEYYSYAHEDIKYMHDPLHMHTKTSFFVRLLLVHGLYFSPFLAASDPVSRHIVWNELKCKNETKLKIYIF